jgi:hypothetical protein
LGIFLKISNYNSEFIYLSSIALSKGTVVNLISKGPKTPPAPELTDYQKEVIFGSMLGDITAERTHLNGNIRIKNLYVYKE